MVAYPGRCGESEVRRRGKIEELGLDIIPLSPDGPRMHP
jgi:hypothetical protein